MDRWQQRRCSRLGFMAKRFYIAVYTDSGMLIGCDHKHKTVTSATACISESGGYVVAIRRGKYLPLTDAEEIEFQQARHGHQKCFERNATARSVLILLTD